MELCRLHRTYIGAVERAERRQAVSRAAQHIEQLTQHALHPLDEARRI